MNGRCSSLTTSKPDEQSVRGSQLAVAALTAQCVRDYPTCVSLQYVLFSLVLIMFLLCLRRFLLYSQKSFLTRGFNYISSFTLKLQGRATSHCIISRFCLESGSHVTGRSELIDCLHAQIFTD